MQREEDDECTRRVCVQRESPRRIITMMMMMITSVHSIPTSSPGECVYSVSPGELVGIELDVRWRARTP